MRTEENVAKFIYIMYSAIRKQYKIGESIDVEDRLSQIQKGSAGGDESTVLIDYFPVTFDMIPHRAKSNIDSVFHNLPFYTNLFGKHFTLKGIIQIVKRKENKLDHEDIKLITEYLKGFKSFVDVERRRLNYKLKRIYFSSNIKYDIEYNEMLLREYEHLITLDYFYKSKKVEKYAVLDLSKDLLFEKKDLKVDKCQ